MATTNYGVNHPVAVKLWSRKLMREALKQTFMQKFIGTGSDAIIQIKEDTSKGPGDRVRCTLRMQLTGAGIEGDGTLEGNEESLIVYTDDLLINQMRHAVRSAGKMSEQRIPFSVREESRIGLTDWWADRIDTALFNQLGGNTNQTDTRYTGHNATVAFDSDHVVYPDDDTSESDVAAGTISSIFSLDLIDTCVEKAKTLTPAIRPVKVMGQEKYCIFLHPYQIHDLRTNTNTGQWFDIQKAAMQGGQISNNPIYTGAHGEYNNVVIHESTRIPEVVSTVKRAVFCGAQAATIAFGQRQSLESPNWYEELFDYGNQLGVSGGMIWGTKKTRYNSADFGTIVVPTYAVAH